MATEPARWRFTVRDYHQMIEAGILTEDDRVELIDGEIIKMTALGGRHVACVGRLTRILCPAFWQRCDRQYPGFSGAQ